MGPRVSAMSQKIKRRIHLIYGIILSVLLVATGVCFAIACLAIYRTGPSPFTPESIGRYWGYIAPLVYVCLAAVVGGIVVSLALPLEAGKPRAARDPGLRLKKLQETVDVSASPELQKRVGRERAMRRGSVVVATILSAVAAIVVLVWCLIPGRFDDVSTAGLQQDILTAVAVILPCAAVGLAAWVAVVLLWGVSVQRETVMLKAASMNPDYRRKPAAGGSGETARPSRLKAMVGKPAFLWTVRGVVFALAVVFIVLGAANGGMADVLGKAIRICTECIGLG